MMGELMTQAMGQRSQRVLRISSLLLVGVVAMTLTRGAGAQSGPMDQLLQDLSESDRSPDEAGAESAPAPDVAPGTLDLRTGGEAPAEGETGSQPPGEAEVLVAEVVVTGTEDPDLVSQVYGAIATQAGDVTTRSQLQEDIGAVFATGLFSDVKAVPSDTSLGVRVTFEVMPNPVLQAVTTEGAQVLPQEVVQEAFGDQQGQVLNFGDLQFGVQAVETWYEENGYVLAKVVDVRSSEDGTVTLEVAEGQIADVQVSGNTTTRDFIVTRELSAQPGDVFNRDQVQQDLQKVFELNLFQDVNVSLEPAQTPEEVVVVINVEERRTGSLGATAGVSSDTGVFGGVSVGEQNLGGNNQQLSLNVQVGTEETLFDLSFTDPQIAGMDPPTAYTVDLANRQSSSFVFDNGISLPNGDAVRINRLGGGVTFSRPIGNGWRASLGPEIEFVDSRDSDGDQQPFDRAGNPIVFNESGQDSYTSLRLGLVQDTRNNGLSPTQGTLTRFSSTQSVGLLESGLNSNRLQASYSQYIPVALLQSQDTPSVFAFDVRAGSVLGDLAPYDAFTIGGGNSVRGFFEGDVGSGRSFAQATTELRFPVFNPVSGVLFADYGTDLGSAAAVIGNPAGVRDKPGSALGLGAGVRIQSPLGPLRVDYGLGQGDSGQSQLHFGIGEKF